MKKLLRHGDVPLLEVTKVEGKVVKHNGSQVIAWGEKTGHNHTISVENLDDMEVRETSNGFILVLKAEGKLTHPEHKTLIIPPGTYRSFHEREHDYFQKSTRRVLD